MVESTLMFTSASSIFFVLCTFPQTYAFPDIKSYEPSTDVMDHMKIDLDQQAIEMYLEQEDDEGFDNAMSVYENGGYSQPFAELRLTEPYGLESHAGIGVTGTSTSGTKIDGLLFSNASEDDELLLIKYARNNTDNTHCFVGGIAEPQIDGCFGEEGSIVIGGQSFDYSYDPFRANYNGRAIQIFSALADSRMRPRYNDENYFVDFGKFVDYYEDADYADEWIQAAYNGQRTHFRTGNADFRGYKNNALAAAIRIATVHMAMAMNIIRMLEHAVDDCNRGCPELCPEIQGKGQPVHSLDEAVGFYTGSLELTSEEGGVLLYAFANEMCSEFMTCGKNSDQYTGNSYVNIEIFKEFNDMNVNLMSFECQDARRNKERIVRLMLVPLIQGTLRAAMKKTKSQEEGVKAVDDVEGASFAASVLPWVNDCDPDAANQIFEMMETGQLETDFEQVKEAFESVYSCLKVDCAAVGGYIDREAGGGYGPGADPCDGELGSNNPRTAASSVGSANGAGGGGSGAWGGFMAFFLISSLTVGILYFVFKRKKSMLQPLNDLELSTAASIS